ncbi:glycosyltransferase family 2 protein [Halomonas sp. PR-M31]|uniref:glycosyltransferase family 2 protein n=1 Tax=Halomonas sp. PR-M31 TaxID=1471202 RepID=UPI00069CF740|nr:glycosyltransferase family 2 protein [Halomonas sp. PR-M31]
MKGRLPSQRRDRRRIRYPSLVCAPQLVPLSDVDWLNATNTADGKAEFQWLSTSDDPQFLLQGPRPMVGWNMLEVTMTHELHRAVVQVYFDTGDGYTQSQSIFLPLRQNKMTKRICFVPYGTRRIRLDPLQSEGAFTISHLRLVWLTPRFAYDRMARRLSSIHPQYRDLATQEVIQSIKREANEDGLSWKSLAVAHYEETFMHCAPESHYRYWLSHIEPMREPDSRQIAVRLAGLDYRPKLGLLLTNAGVSSERLAACIESVLAQRYPAWQLYIASTVKMRAVLEHFAAMDARIVLVPCSEHAGSAAARNAALALAQGDFTAVLEGKDQLAPNALYHLVDALNRHPEAELLYGDEDALDENDSRCDPHFKPQWNPDLLLAQNYIGHVALYRTERLRHLGGFRQGFEANPSHELILRFTRGLTTDQIRHVSFVLHHRHDESVVEQPSARETMIQKSIEESSEPGLSAVNEYLASAAPGAKATMGVMPRSYRVQWPLPDPQPLVSLLIPTRDRVEILKPCVDAILERTEYANFEVLILDNQSSCRQTLAYMMAVSADPRVRILRWNQPFNYSAINNFGARHAQGSILGLVNNDIEPINDDWLCEMVRQVCREEIGCVGAKLYYPNDSIQHGGVILGLGGVAGHAHRFFPRAHSGYRDRLQLVQNLSAVTAACLLLRKTVFEQVGGLNEESLTVAYNDVDLCLKVREAGYRNLWTPHAELYHHESVSRGADDNPKKRARAQREIDYMRRTWGPQLDSDPAYNPNLTLAYEDFSLR